MTENIENHIPESCGNVVSICHKSADCVPDSVALSAEQLHVLQHALGLDQYGQGTMYRNHYVGDEHECRPLVAMGYMVERPASELTGGDPLFHVTDAGKAAVLAESPKPPKLTRGQKRYRAFLKHNSGLKFREWLKYYGSEAAR